MLSVRRAIDVQERHRPVSEISIHALREEGDFYFDSFPIGKWLFLSTPSARRAT